MVKILMTSHGFEYLEQDIMASANRARFLEPALYEIADDMMDKTKIQFSSQGRRGGGSWAMDSREWEDRKNNMGLDPLILVATGRLRGSVTEKGHPDQLLEVDHNTLRFGSTVDYADTHQRGGRGKNFAIPARPFIQFVPGDTARWSQIISTHIVDPMKRRMGTGRA